MGFGMKKIIALSALSLLILNSCMKKPDHAPDYGPEVPFEAVEKASKTDMPIAPEMIKKGQIVSLDVYSVIDTNSPVTLWQRSDEVTFQSQENDAQGNPVSYHWTFNVQLRERSPSGQWLVSEQPYGPLCYTVDWDSEACNQAATQSLNPKKSIKPFTVEGVRAKDVSQPYKVTYHNLKREDGFLPVPQTVSNRPNCGGVKNCAQGLRFVRVSVDRVLWESEEKGVKTTYRFTYSSDIPTYVYDWLPGDVYPTNLVESCAQTWVEVSDGTQTQVVPVRECMEITDFQFGS